MTTNTEALAALSYAEAAKLLADELDYKYQRGIDPHMGEWREAVTLLRSLAALCAELEAERDALVADAERYRWLKANAGFGIRQNQVTELSVMLYALPNHMGELDAAIDAARKDQP